MWTLKKKLYLNGRRPDVYTSKEREVRSQFHKLSLFGKNGELTCRPRMKMYK